MFILILAITVVLFIIFVSSGSKSDKKGYKRNSRGKKQTTIRNYSIDSSNNTYSSSSTIDAIYSDRVAYKGKIGEIEIMEKLSSLPQSYTIFNDVYLYVNNRSVQIDHIIISPYGVFVIEVKNYNGYIYGTDDAEYWTKYLNEKKFKFRNPLKQNYSHVFSLQCILGMPRNYFIPIVVFSNKVKIKCETKEFVIYSNQLKSVINSFRTPILAQNVISTAIYLLNNSILLDKNRALNHANSINQYIKEKNDLINQGICPRCRGKLVERNGKYGSFVGCSNYPDCKFTKDI